MNRKYLLVFSAVACVLFVAGCGLSTARLKQSADSNDGSLVVYLEAFPHEVGTLRFSVVEVGARTADGADVPLDLVLQDALEIATVRRQRLLASGSLPAGKYVGLSFKVSKATVQGEEGDAELLVPKERVFAPYPFRLAPGKADALFLGFHPRESFTNEVFFKPLFTPHPPGRQILEQTGYVIDLKSGKIVVINKKTGIATGVIATRGNPSDIAVDQLLKRAYVALAGDDSVLIVDLFSQEVIGKVKLAAGDEPVGIGLSDDGRVLLTANYGSGTVSVIDPFLSVERARIRVGDGPRSVTISPAGLRAFVADYRSGTLSVVDLSARRLVASIKLRGNPLQSMFSRSGDRLYVICGNSPNLFVVDPALLSVIDAIQSGDGATYMTIDSLRGILFLGKKTGEIVMIDPFSRMVFDTILLDSEAGRMTIDNEERNLLVVLPERGTLQIIATSAKRLLHEIDVGSDPCGIAILNGK